MAPARWSHCGRLFQCSTIVVPLDYDDRGAGVLHLSLIRRPAADRAARIGSLLVNPGGPGASGVELVRDGVETFPHELLDQFDLVGWDPRGVNLSSGIRCIDNLDPRAQLDPSPDDAAELDALVADARTYAGACAARNADVLAHLSTDDVVRDLDFIRMALGEDELTYLGFSYGTLIGALYADRYPDRIRAMALDGAIDPSLALEDVRTGQAKAFEGALGRFLDDCAGRRDCVFNHGRGTKAAFDALMAAIDTKPLPTPRVRDRRSVGPGLAWSAVLGSMYSPQGWQGLEAALALAEQGDGSLFILLADPFRGRKSDGSYSNQLDAYTANICADYPTSTSIPDYTSLAGRLTSAAPHFAAQVAYNDLACAFWNEPSRHEPARVTGAGSPPIVVVGSSGDPATPPEWAVALADQLERGVLVTRTGEGHTGFGFSTCVQDHVVEYLVSLKVPKHGTTCD